MGIWFLPSPSSVSIGVHPWLKRYPTASSRLRRMSAIRAGARARRCLSTVRSLSRSCADGRPCRCRGAACGRSSRHRARMLMRIAVIFRRIISTFSIARSIRRLRRRPLQRSRSLVHRVFRSRVMRSRSYGVSWSLCARRFSALFPGQAIDPLCSTFRAQCTGSTTFSIRSTDRTYF